MKIFGFDFSNLRYSPEENYEHNKRALVNLDYSAPKNGFSDDGFIENQHRLAQIKYSARDFAYCGCGCIAYWNILFSRGNCVNLAKLAKEMEKGCVFNGVLGTNAFFLKRFMEKKGEKVETSLSPKEILEKGAKEAIVLYYRKPRVAHYVAFTYHGEDEKGESLYRFYNVGGKIMRRFGEGNPIIMTLAEFIEETDYNFCIYYKIK